jgi:hypothetical protein
MVWITVHIDIAIVLIIKMVHGTVEQQLRIIQIVLHQNYQQLNLLDHVNLEQLIIIILESQLVSLNL